MARVEAKLRDDIKISKGQMLQDAKENSERFAVNIANKLRSATSARLIELHPDANVREIEVITEQDGRERHGRGG